MANEIEVGAILEGKVTGITKFGAFVSLPGGKSGLVHISEIAYSYVKRGQPPFEEEETKNAAINSNEKNQQPPPPQNGRPPPPPRPPPPAPAAGRPKGDGEGYRSQGPPPPGRSGPRVASPAVLPTPQPPRSPRPLTTCSSSSCPIPTASSPGRFFRQVFPPPQQLGRRADPSKLQRRAILLRGVCFVLIKKTPLCPAEGALKRGSFRICAQRENGVGQHWPGSLSAL